MTVSGQVDAGRLRHAVKTVLFNQVCLSGPVVVLTYMLMKWRGDPCGPELPTFHWVLLELAVCGLMEEILFYYTHRSARPLHASVNAKWTRSKENYKCEHTLNQLFMIYVFSYKIFSDVFRH